MNRGNQPTGKCNWHGDGLCGSTSLFRFKARAFCVNRRWTPTIDLCKVVISQQTAIAGWRVLRCWWVGVEWSFSLRLRVLVPLFPTGCFGLCFSHTFCSDSVWFIRVSVCRMFFESFVCFMSRVSVFPVFGVFACLCFLFWCCVRLCLVESGSCRIRIPVTYLRIKDGYRNNDIQAVSEKRYISKCWR